MCLIFKSTQQFPGFPNLTFDLMYIYLVEGKCIATYLMGGLESIKEDVSEHFINVSYSDVHIIVRHYLKITTDWNYKCVCQIHDREFLRQDTFLVRRKICGSPLHTLYYCTTVSVTVHEAS